MQYLIVEDERLTANRLAKMVSTFRPAYRLLAVLDSVASAVKWLEQHPHPQLAFFDIQLADGISFEIFELAKIDFPVIFTTAYNEYALKAFKVNSIDYLLKPTNGDELQAAIDKFERTRSTATAITPGQVTAILDQLGSSHKQRFLVKVGEHLKLISCRDIALFHSMEKSTFIRTAEGRDYAIDQTLEQVELAVNPAEFYRVNRSCIVGIHAIRDIVAYSGSRLKVLPTVKTDEDIVVSRERVQGFKAWLER